MEFAGAGWDIILCYYADESQIAAADSVAAGCRELGASVALQSVDVSKDAECRAAASDAEAAFGRLDALVNCAGTTRFIPHEKLDELDADEFRRTYDVNVIGTYQMIRACAELLRRDGEGSVVNISSIGGLYGLGSSVAYAASKGAVNTLTLALARSLAPSIRVNAIAPGYVDGGLPSRVLSETELERVVRAQIDSTVLKRISQPAEVAALAWFLCDRARGMTGEIVSLDNGFHLKLGA